MAIRDRNTLKAWFLKGMKPLAAQFADWMDSFWHKDEKIPITSVDNLASTLNNKANTSALNAHVADKNNPHNVTAEKLGAATVEALETETQNRIDGDEYLQKQIDDLNEVDLSGYQKTDEKGVANGYAPLGADNKVPAKHLPTLPSVINLSTLPLQIDCSESTLYAITANTSGNINLINVPVGVSVVICINLSNYGYITFTINGQSIPAIGEISKYGKHTATIINMGNNFTRLNIAHYE